MKLDELWAELEGFAPEGHGGRQVQRIFPESSVDLFLAIEIKAQADRNRRTLELQVEESALEQEPPRSSRQVGLSVEMRDSGRVAVILGLEDPGARDLFTALCTDVASVTAGRNSDADAVASFLGRFAKWQRMFQIAPEGLAPRRQRGLYGELVTLRDHIASRTGFDEAVLAWKGPDGAPRDFELRGVGVEVKTSAANEPQVVPIHGERQLDDSGLDALCLVHHSLEVIRDSSDTLPITVASIRRLGDGSSELGTFEDRLIQSGYADIHAPLYKRTGYASRRVSHFDVKDGFPRILEGDLLDGVGAVRYSLAIDACRDFEVKPEFLTGHLAAGK